MAEPRRWLERSGGTPVSSLVVRGVRGSDGEHTGMVRRLGKDLDASVADVDPADSVYAAAGLEPGGYTGKLVVSLEQATAANKAIARTCRGGQEASSGSAP